MSLDLLIQENRLDSSIFTHSFIHSFIRVFLRTVPILLQLKHLSRVLWVLEEKTPTLTYPQSATDSTEA